MSRFASVAIVPFENLSGSPDDVRLAGGFVQDLIAELARFTSIGVIAAESTFSVNSTELDDGEIGRRLDVAYLLKGSVRRAARSLRLGVRLVEAKSGRLLWAERYDFPQEDVFSVQDEIAAKVANALTSRIDQAVLRSSRRRQMTNLAAYECWLRGMECLQRGTAASDQEARVFFEQALEIDPHDARARAGMSLSHFNEWSCQAWGCWEEKERQAYEEAKEAEALNPDDALMQVILAKVEQYRRQHGQAEARYRRALQLAPNDAHVVIQLSVGFALLGEAALAAELGKRAVALHPLCPSWYFYYTAMPHFVLRDYSRAVEEGSKTPTIVTDGPAYLAAAHAYLGQREKARERLDEFLEVFSDRITGGRPPERGEPMRWLMHVNPFRRDEDLAHLVEGLRLAGLEDASPGETPGAPPVSWPVGNVFRREGVLWTMCFDHQVVHLPEVRGFVDLARLLERPGEEVHCSCLAGVPVASGRGTALLDERARQAYRSRLRELEAELADAGEANDAGRSERLTEEKEHLLDEIRRATGLGGRDRKMADTSERARSAVTWRIRSAIKKLEPAHPALAKHLGNSVKTGVFCSYSPEKETPWFV